MGLREDALKNNGDGRAYESKIKMRRPVTASVVSSLALNKKRNNNKNFKQIFLLSFDALRERKARSALTILMVVVGSGLMIAINGMSAGQTAFINKQLNTLAPNIMFVSSGQHLRGGPDGPPTIIFNAEVVNRLKSLPFVQDVVPSYQGQLQLNSQGSILNSQVMGMDASKVYLVNPSLQLVDGSSIQPNNPSAILVGDSIANPPGMTTPFVTVGQNIKATYSFSDQSGKLQQQSRSFVVTGVMQPSGNNQLDRAVIINQGTANSLFHKAGKFDQIVVAAQSADNVNAEYPRPVLDAKGHANMVISDRYVEDGSYLRIQNVTFAYSLPSDVISKIKLSKVRLYTGIQNLYTFTKYSGYDPEVGSLNQDALLTGVDNGRYPSPRTFTLGLNVEF